MADTAHEEALLEEIEALRHDPLEFAQFAYPWMEGDLLGSDGPRKWQAMILKEIRDHLQDEKKRYTPCRIAVSSGHGIGKSALVGQVIGWALSTCSDCKIVTTASIEPQLRTKTIPEVTKWFKMLINSHWWKVMTTSIRSADPKHYDSWRTDFLTWSENNTEAFAGLHNKGKRIVLIFDEASAIADKVWEVAEGALTDEYTEIIWLAFGNPTQPTGRFRECFGSARHRWKTHQIDSREVEGTNKDEINNWIADYGEDSDFVRVRVRGEFPRSGSSQFIADDVIFAATKYRADGYSKLPKVLGVDVGRFGDDPSVICVRQGRKARILSKLQGMDSVQVAERVIEQIKLEQPDAYVVDGEGVGAGVIDQLKYRGYGRKLFDYYASQKAVNPVEYANKKAECWGKMRQWLKDGAEIPDDPELKSELAYQSYQFSHKGQIMMTPKAVLKRNGLGSPDVAESLMMTFAVDLKAKEDPIDKLPVYRDTRYAAQSWMS